MYTGSFAMNSYGERDFLQSGVSSGAYLAYYDEGWVSLLLGSVPQNQLPWREEMRRIRATLTPHPNLDYLTSALGVDTPTDLQR